MGLVICVFFFKQKTAYEMRISDWSSDVCSSDLPMREDAIFLLASLTKPIVTAAIMRLVEQHRIELDAPVTDWLPDFQPKTADRTTPVITIRQLLTHTARTEERREGKRCVRTLRTRGAP